MFFGGLSLVMRFRKRSKQMKNFYLKTTTALIVCGLTVFFSMTASAQIGKNRPAPPRNRPKLPNCSQLSGEDLLFKNRKCLTGETGTVTTVSEYRRAQNQTRNSSRPDINSDFNQMETLSSGVKGGSSTPSSTVRRKTPPRNKTKSGNPNRPGMRRN